MWSLANPTFFIALTRRALPGLAVTTATLLAVGLWMAFNAPPWLLLVVWMPIVAALCIGLLRPFKGVLVALQFHHKAGEQRNDDF